jgi:hypothetical protein
MQIPNVLLPPQPVDEPMDAQQPAAEQPQQPQQPAAQQQQQPEQQPQSAEEPMDLSGEPSTSSGIYHPEQRRKSSKYSAGTRSEPINITIYSDINQSGSASTDAFIRQKMANLKINSEKNTTTTGSVSSSENVQTTKTSQSGSSKTKQSSNAVSTKSEGSKVYVHVEGESTKSTDDGPIKICAEGPFNINCIVPTQYGKNYFFSDKLLFLSFFFSIIDIK